MDTRTIIAFGLMILIYIFFFQPQMQAPKPIASVASNAVSTTTPAPEIVREVAKPAEFEEQSKQRFWVQNQKVKVEVDGFGSVYQVVFLKYDIAVGSDEPVKSVFFPKALNRTSMESSFGQPQWKLAREENGAVLLHGTSGDLLILRKIQLVSDSYILKITDDLRNAGGQSAKVGLKVDLQYPPLPEAPPAGFFQKIFQPQAEIHEVVWQLDGSVAREPFQGISANIDSIGNIAWAGFAQKYFFFGLVPENVSATALRIENQKESGFSQTLTLSDKVIEPAKTTDYTYQVYLGPKALPELKKAAPDLPEVVDYGSWIGPISRILLSILHGFYKVIPNYGIGIILLTIFVKLVLYPLAYKSAVSMRRLQQVQPKMKEIRDRYKDDKQRMNAEMMALYKTEKVNPVGGCLPILLQMPVFFALYRVFFHSIEFRHAPFFGWVKDLSVHDPYFVTPVLMTALMWYQTKVTPQPPAMEENEAAQAQRAMMKWMPIVFGAIMIFLPSGLTLYFLVNALLSLVQQIYLNKHLHLKFPLAAK